MAKRSPGRVEPLTRKPSIEVISWGWAKPIPSDPLWAEVQHSEWPGYVFRLTFAGGDLLALEVRRDGADAAPLRAHLLQRVNLGALERAVRREVNVFESSWQELVDSTAGLSGENVVPVKVGMSPGLAEWFEGSRQAKPSRERWLAGLAERYVDTLGDPQQTAILAEEFGYKRSSVAATIRGRATSTSCSPLQPKAALAGVSLRKPGRSSPNETSSQPNRRNDGQATR